MTEMTDDASRRVDAYLRRVRASLAGAPGVQVDEVLEGVREHLDHAFGEVEGRVTGSDVDRILDDLGDPASWASVEGAWWRKLLGRLQQGPEDWRLSYLALGAFLASFLGEALAGVLLPASFLLARAGVTMTLSERGTLEGRKWLLYPPLVTIYAGLAPTLVGWPAAVVHLGVSPGGFLAEALGGATFGAGLLEPQAWLAYGPLALLATGLWCVLLGLTLRLWPRWLGVAFRPFGQGVRPVHVAGPGIGLAVAAAGLLAL